MYILNTIQSSTMYRTGGLTILLAFIYLFAGYHLVQAGNVGIAGTTYQQVQQEMGLTNLYVSHRDDQTLRVSMDVEDILLIDLLHELADEIEVDVSINTNRIKDKKVSYEAWNKSVFDVLLDLLESNNLEFTLSQDRKVLIVQNQEEADGFLIQETVSGQVIDANLEENLPGVNILVKGTTTGTSTDSNGNYELSVSSLQDTLIFSFVGYQTREVPINGRTVLNVELQSEAVSGEELVVVGYGSVRRSDLTGSVSNLSGRSIEDRQVPTLGEAFVGQLAGVRAQQTSGEPGRPLSISIRGVNSLNSSIEPLYVLDGVPIESMRDINPNNIESIEVLKDAASAAIYGSRGANGVVLISTKQGNTDARPTIRFNSSYGLQEVAGYYDTMNREEWLAYTTWARNFLYIQQGGSMSDPMSARPSGLQIPEAWTADPESLADTDWQKELYGGLSPQQNYDLSVSGGGDIGTFMVAAGYMNQDGIVVATDYERINLRANTVINASENIRFGVNIAPSISTRHPGPGDGPFMGATFSPIVPLDSNTEETGYDYGIPYWNPIERYKQAHHEYKTTRVLNNVWGELEVMESILFTSRMGYNYEQQSLDQFFPTNINRGNPSFGNANVSRNNGFSLQNTLEFNPSVSPLIDMNLLLGQSFEDYRSFYIGASATNYPNDLVPTLNVAGSKTNATTTEEANKLSSFFGRLNLGWDDRYLLTATVRRDGSSKFGNDTKWGWFPSVSAAWRIEQEEFLQDADWLSLLKIRLMIGKSGNERIGNYEHIALMGSANYNLNGSFLNGLAPSTLANPLLGWETKESRGIGLDISGFNDRVQVNMDYYLEHTTDMLLNVPTPHMTGFASYRKNIGKVQNRGWEFELTTHNLSNDRLSWTTSLNISRNANEVLRLGEDDAPILTSAGRAGTANTWITKVGEPIGSFYLWETDGLLMPDEHFDENGEPLVPIYPGQRAGNSKLVDHNNDGQINVDDKIVAGNAQPDFTFGITNRFAFKNFDLSLLLHGQLGAEIFHASWRYWDTGGSRSFNHITRWLRSYKHDHLLPEGENPYPETDVDLSWDGETRASSRILGTEPENTTDNMYDASFLRVKNLTIGYNLPSHISGRIGFQNVRIYLMGDNLYTWDNYIGPSPESFAGQNDGSSSSILSAGSEMAAYGIARKYSFGINFTF